MFVVALGLDLYGIKNQFHDFKLMNTVPVCNFTIKVETEAVEGAIIDDFLLYSF